MKYVFQYFSLFNEVKFVCFFGKLNLTISKMKRESLMNPLSPPCSWRMSDQKSSDNHFTILRKKKKRPVEK